MWSDPEQLGHPLEGACGLEDDFGVERIVTSLWKVGQECGRTFDADEINNVEPGGPNFAGELTRTMGGELDRAHAGVEPIALQTALVVVVERLSVVGVHAGKSDGRTPRHEQRFPDWQT